MPLKRATSTCRRCGAEFRKKRIEQDYCSAGCRKSAWRGTKKRRILPPRCTPLGSVANGPFYPSNSVACKAPRNPDLGAFVHAQIVAQQDQPNPIHFVTPDGVSGRVWLATDKKGAKIIGDDRHWRLNVPAAAREDRDASAVRPPASLRDIWETELGRLRGFRVRLCIEDEKALQVLGCGWRIVTCQFRGDKVLVHHNGNVATMKRSALRHIVSATKAAKRRCEPSSLTDMHRVAIDVC
jgi:hypothetical protein